MNPALEPALRAVEPALRLVSERRLLKVLVYLRDHGHAVPINPALPYWVAVSDLRAADVLPEAVYEGGHARLLLVTDPNDRMLDDRPLDDQLRAYWRLLFQAAVAAAVDAKVAKKTLNPARSAVRLARLGPAAGREIAYVLHSDHLIDAAADETAHYRAFAATYLDLNAFAAAVIDEYFPSLPPRHVVLGRLEKDLNVASLLAHARPAGAADHRPEVAPDEHWMNPVDSAPRGDPVVPGGDPRGLLARADRAAKNGNFVRAAVLRTQAAESASGDDQTWAASTARAALGHLVQALAEVLEWDDATRGEWRQALVPLLAPAARGVWPRAARCLYDLQKLPADLARDAYAVDLVESLRTLGRRPVKRPLPRAREPQLLVRLRAASAQMLRSGLGGRAQFRLDRLFHHELHRLEQRIRHALTPVVAAALHDSGFRPANRVEEVAREKAVAELLDRVCERGFLRVGDLRDAIARNQLKMPDLAGPGEFVRGDPLLRADTRLAYDLDGVYRRGEVYLRTLQRGSSLFFGTRTGRWLTLYVVAPFLAAFLTLMAVEEMRHLGGNAFAFAAKILAPHPAETVPVVADEAPVPRTSIQFDWDAETKELAWFDREEASALAREVVTSTAAAPGMAEHHGSALVSVPSVLGLGIFLLLLFHVPPFRRAVLAAVRTLVHFVRLVLWDVPNAVLRSPAVRAARYSGPMRFIHRRLGGALAVTAAAVVALSVLGSPPDRLLKTAGFAFLIAALGFNTPPGRIGQDRLAERFADWWRLVRFDLLPGLIGTVLALFARLANWVERQLYGVDEWLHYRRGDSQGSLAAKAVLGLLWFPVAYLARFTFYLLVEPQINPVKHFPVVTVSHKVLLPMTPTLAGALQISEAEAAGLLGCIPGIFGFIAWELMANWQLYRANRPARLRPVTIGSHGETMRGLLRPGFHSGTVPKLFRKLRAAARKGEHGSAGRTHHDLDHATEGVRRFVERDLIALLTRRPEWHASGIEVGAVRFGCQRVVVELSAPCLGPDTFVLAFENRGGRIDATLERAGWLDRLTPPMRAELLSAVSGLFDMGAAELFEDRARTVPPEGQVVEGSGDLARPYLWAEWVMRWERAS